MAPTSRSRRAHAFSGLAVADRWQPALEGVGEPARLEGDRVSAEFFGVLGVAPALGRAFEAADEAPGSPPVVIVTAGFATRAFGSARAALDRSLTLDGDAYRIAGILPAGFENVLSPTADVWAPLRYRRQAPFQSREWGHHLRMVGRLAAGVSADAAREETVAIGGSPSEAFPRPAWASLAHGLSVTPLQDSVTRGIRPALLAILAAVLALLVIACINVANLLLARGVSRRAELAMRAALGAGRGRLARQLLTESALLALLGGAAGLGAAAAGTRMLVALAPQELPRLDAVRLDAAAFVFALFVTALVGIGTGLVPALRGARAELRSARRSGARATGAEAQLLRRGLVVTQVALALVLLVGAGLLLTSVQRLLATAPGFDASRVITMRIVATARRFQSNDAALRFFEQALEAVRQVPGVQEAALTSQLPLSGDLDSYGADFESRERGDQSATGAALRYAVTPGWFRTMRIPLLEGRLLSPEDRPGAPEAVLISESFAKRLFGDRSPLGQRVRFGPEQGRAGRPADVVVGVVGDVKQTSLALGPPDAFYVAMGQWPWVDAVQALVVRTDRDPAGLVPAIEDAVWSVDPTPPLVRVATMRKLLAASEARRRFALTIFTTFALAALVLAALGLYGVMAGSVAERTGELGLRSALGAPPRGAVTLVLGQGLKLAGLGIGIGAGIAAAATRGLEALLYGVTPLDARTYLGVIALLVACSLVACCLPAWRAARVDPSAALRAE